METKHKWKVRREKLLPALEESKRLLKVGSQLTILAGNPALAYEPFWTWDIAVRRWLDELFPNGEAVATWASLPQSYCANYATVPGAATLLRNDIGTRLKFMNDLLAIIRNASYVDQRGDDDGNVFKRMGDGWFIRFEGKDIFLKDTYGLHYIAMVLQKEIPISAHELRLGIAKKGTASLSRDVVEDFVVDGTADGEGSTGVQRGRGSRSRDPVVDIRHVREQIGELESEIARAKASGDHAAADRAQQELDALRSALTKGRCLGGRPRMLDDAREHDRKAVHDAVRVALDLMAKANKKLAQHFRKHLVTGNHCRYTGTAGWKVFL